MPQHSSSQPRPINIHCHHTQAGEALQILNQDLSDFVLTRHADTANSPKPISIGMHPWSIAGQDIATALERLNILCRQTNVLAIGECGLDKCIDTPLATQTAVFRHQIELAEQIRKPLIIHCVRAFNELLALRKILKPRQPWIIHGFTGKSALAAQLLKHGCYLSFGKALLKPDSPACQTLPHIPLDRLFLETDAATDISIAQIYAAAAKILGLDVGALSAELHRNFTRVFLHD